MAIAPTGAIYKSLVFDGEDSRNYGVYITGEAVYNAPGRDVEMVEIPGRNGSFALDKGRFQNIEVSYPAGIFADNEADFAEAISDFRNFLCSRRGYVRLTDEYNPSEYRMAIYKSGLEVSPAQLKAGEFEIVFDCKPQRWLTSGEEAVTIGEWGETETASSDIVSVENPNGVLAVKSLEVDLEPIQSGSGTPSPTNIRPISGYSSAVVNRTGKNLYDALTSGGRTNSGITWTYNSDGSVTASGTATGNSWAYGTAPQAILKQGTYIASVNSPFGLVIQNITDGGYFYNGDDSTATFTVSKETTVGIHARVKNGTTINATTGIMLEVGSLATEWEPYKGNTYTIDLNGTRYGGTLDVTTGVLTVDREIVDLGDKTWTKISVSQGTMFRTTQSGIKQLSSTSEVIRAICDRYESVAQTSRAEDTVSTGVDSGGNNIDIIDSSYSTAAAFKTAMSGAQLVYELAEPQTYQLTAQQIELLTGDNNIWSSGGAITLEYGQNPSVLFNPTLFESSPLLESTGYGNILVNGEKITIGSLPYGKIIIANGITDEFRSPLVYTPTDIDVSRLNVGDTFVVKGMTVTTQTSLDDPLITSYEESITALTNCTGYVSGDGETWSLTMNDTQFVYGTSKTVNAQMAVEVKEIYNGNPVITTYTWDADIRYNGSSILYFEANRTFVGTIVSSTLSVEPIYANSTVLAANLTMFIDLDLGEAWNNDGDTIASLNNVVQLPAQLPTLKSGINSISFDGTITSLKITPRWWKV